MTSIASRLNGLTASKSAAQAPILAQIKQQGRTVVDLSLGEFKVAPPQALVNALAECLTRSSNLYTDTIGLAPLREQLATRVSRSSGSDWTAANIAVTAGAKQALFNTVAAILEPGDEILIPSPYWTTFPAQAQLVGARAVKVDLAPYGFAPNLRAFEAALTPSTRALLLNSPNNPTGRVYTTEEWQALFDLAQRRDLWVIVDECYKEYCFPRERYVAPAPLWAGDPERLIVVDSFSKSLSVTGWRLGYLVAQPRIIESIRTIQNHTTSNPSSLIQHAMSQALQFTDFEDFITARWQALSEHREIVRTTVDYIARDSALTPAGGFFFYVPTASLTGDGRPWRDVNELCNDLLRETTVLVVPGTAFGDRQGFRMSFCGSMEDVRLGAERLQSFFAARGC